MIWISGPVCQTVRPASVTWKMMPLLPAGVMLYSMESSNQSYWSLVTRSPAFLGSTQVSAPSLTCQPGLMVSLLKFDQQSRDLPSKRSFQPAFFSSSVRVFGSAALRGVAASRSAASRPGTIGFRLFMAAHVGLTRRTVKKASPGDAKFWTPSASNTGGTPVIRGCRVRLYGVTRIQYDMDRPTTTPLPLPLSTQARRTEDSPINALIAAKMANPDLINLAAGLVDEQTLPVEECRAIAQKILSDPRRGRRALQ